jgi:hypothetical protein
MSDNLQKLIALAKADNGKFFVIDESGNPTLVIMSIDEYENILLKKVQNQLEDIEDINKKIIEAQKQEQDISAKQTQEDLVSEVIDSTFYLEPEMPMAQHGELEDI